MFDPNLWLRDVIEAANIAFPLQSVDECRWAYEVLDRKTSKLADVAIHARSGINEFVVVVESKRKNGSLKKDDVDPGSYLDLDEFSWCKRRMLIYLVDEQDIAKVKSQICDPWNRAAVLSWQALGGIQIKLANSLDCSAQIRSFVAGAIQYQYCQHGIDPAILAYDYLADEPHKESITKDNPDKMRDYYTPWRLPSRQMGPFQQPMPEEH
ncbi:MAG: hypothetical protein J0M04_16420 [Verrucomicrobia bacterium]|nr:hypothetical protein [Verrucomicrobiota bacterium]